MEIEILHAFSPLLVVAWDQSGSLPQTPEWYQATLTGPLVSVGGCRALSESVYPPYCVVHSSTTSLLVAEVAVSCVGHNLRRTPDRLSTRVRGPGLD